MSVYLDFNSSAPIDKRVLSRMIAVYEGSYGNADSRTHDYGTAARRIVEDARASVATILGIKNDEVYFTSGATESNNIALQGLQDYAAKTGKKHIISSSIEHKAIINTLKHLQSLGFDVDLIDPDRNGRIDAAKILEHVRPETLLVCVMHVNNETGTIQPIIEIGELLKQRDVLFHVDATQSFGKLIDELQQTNYDTLAMSAHKISGPQGVGALILRKKAYARVPVQGIMYGGQQEHGIRPGTIPVALVAGLGEACRIAVEDHQTNIQKCAQIRDDILNQIKASGIKYSINGDQSYCVPSTLNVCFPGVSSEALMLSTKQFCAISNGSACNSNSYEPSYVLRAMGIPDDQIECSVRLSWGPMTDLQLLHDSFEQLLEVTKCLC